MLLITCLTVYVYELRTLVFKIVLFFNVIKLVVIYQYKLQYIKNVEYPNQSQEQTQNDQSKKRGHNFQIKNENRIQMSKAEAVYLMAKTNVRCPNEKQSKAPQVKNERKVPKVRNELSVQI